MKATTRPRPLASSRQAPVHPGEVFREDYRLALDPPLSQAEAARRLGWSTNRLNELELGKRGVTADGAIALSELTSATPEFWLNLQMQHDLWHALKARATKRPNSK